MFPISAYSHSTEVSTNLNPVLVFTFVSTPNSRRMATIQPPSYRKPRCALFANTRPRIETLYGHFIEIFRFKGHYLCPLGQSQIYLCRPMPSKSDIRPSPSIHLPSTTTPTATHTPSSIPLLTTQVEAEPAIVARRKLASHCYTSHSQSRTTLINTSYEKRNSQGKSFGATGGHGFGG